MANLPRVALILTGGTIDSLGKDRLDLAWYIEAGKRLNDGELLLVDTEADSFRVVSRLRLFDESPSKQTLLLSHPALVKTRLYVRGESELVCADIGDAAR